MTAKAIVYLAAALALVGSLATCAPANAQTNVLADYVSTLPADIQRDAFAIRASLKRPVVTESVTNVVRATRNLENQLKALVVTNLLTEAQWSRVDLRDERIDTAIETRMGRAGITDAEWITLAKLQSRIEILRRRITRQGGDPTGPDAGKASLQQTVRTEGPPRWQSIGLPALPTAQAIAESLQ